MQQNPFAGYEPYDGSSDSESEGRSLTSGSETDGTSDDDRASHDALLSAQDAWRAQGQAWIAGPSRFVLPEGPGRPDNRLGMYNTEFQYAEERRVSVLMLDSLDRDQTVYPLPTSLRLKLPRVYKNVERIDICQVKFLSGRWTFSPARGNTTLWYLDSSGGVTVAVDISAGTYNGQQLVDALATAFLAVPGGCPLSISYNCTRGRFVITATRPVTLLFASRAAIGAGPTDWGIGWNLGFGGPAVDLTGTVFEGTAFPRLYDDYIFLRLNDADKMNDVDHTDLEVAAQSQDSTGQVAHYFGKLLLNTFGCWAQTFIESPKRFRPVLGRLERLNVDWMDRHGVALTGADAAACDWHMTVRITEVVEGPSVTSSLALSRGLQAQNSAAPGRGQ